MSRCRHVSVVCVLAKCGLVVVGGCWWLLVVAGGCWKSLGLGLGLRLGLGLGLGHKLFCACSIDVEM